MESVISVLGLVVALVALVASVLASRQAKAVASATPWGWDDKLVALVHGLVHTVEAQTGTTFDLRDVMSWGLERYRREHGADDRYYRLLSMLAELAGEEKTEPREGGGAEK